MILTAISPRFATSTFFHMRGSKAVRARWVNGLAAVLIALAATVLSGALSGCANEDTNSPYPSHCDNGRRDGNESHTDCGGSCAACEAGVQCVVASDCQSRVCSSTGFCLITSCKDGARNGDESDVDCGGACDTCAGAKTCAAHGDCASAVCRDFRCAETSCGDGEQNADESDVDCGGPCEGCAAKKRCDGDDDCASLVCGDNGRCNAPSCDDGVRNQGETAIDCGGASCDACEDGSVCVEEADCASENCFIGRCISCEDGLQNGDETGRDCGGSCDPCRAKEECKINEDCESKICDEGVCTAAACDDGVQNRDESDTDCGGTDCDACADGGACVVAADCVSGVCADEECQEPNCSDGVRNGGEADVDCGGATACDRCPDFRMCTAPTDCVSDVCNSNSVCGDQKCLTQRLSPTSGYRYCSFQAVSVGCPDISGTGTDTGIDTYGESATVGLGFDFVYGGDTYNTVGVSSHGALAFDGTTLSKDNVDTDILTDPNDIVAVFWDDLDASFAGAQVRTRVVGTAPNRRFIVRWEVGARTANATELAVFSAVVEEGGDIRVCYEDTEFGDFAADEGRGATAGIFVGGSPLVYAFNRLVLDPPLEIVYFNP